MGVVRGTHGHQGELRVEPYTDNPSRFAAGRKIWVAGVPYRLKSARRVGGALLVGLGGVDSREAARGLLAATIEVPEADVPVPSAGSFYHYQLIGLSARDSLGASLGKVTEIIRTGANDAYVLRDSEKEWVVPAVADVVDIDLKAGWLTVVLPVGLEPRRVASPKQRSSRPLRTAGSPRSS